MASATLDRSKTMKALIAGALIAVACAQPAAAQAWQFEELQNQLRQMQYDIEDDIAALRRDQQIQLQELHDQQLLFGNIPVMPRRSGPQPIGPPLPPGTWEKSFPIDGHLR